MAARGRKPIPFPQKDLRGNPGKRSPKDSVIQPKAGSLIPPKWLDEAARAEWRRQIKELRRLGLATTFDRVALACYCQTYSRMVQAEEELREAGSLTFDTPNGAVQQRPEVGIINTCQKLLQSWGAEFGFTPSSRSRLAYPQGRHEDEFEAFMKTKSSSRRD